MNKINKYTILIFALFISTLSFAQVGIGTQSPDNSAILHLDVTNLGVNEKKGFLGPKVALTSSTDQTTIPSPAVGLLVYNTGTAGLQIEGYLFWNGTEWRKLDDSTTESPQVDSVLCLSASLDPGNYTSGVPYVGNLRVPYTGGNGGTYSSGATITVNGLEFVLRAGKLEFGSGELIFSVAGTPTVSSPTTTTLAIEGSTGNNIAPFITNAQHCSATFGDLIEAEFKVVATVGPLFATTDPSAGYHRFVTTPDGKYSVRVVINEGGTFANSDLQIRSNSGTPTILWHGRIFWVNGTAGFGNNGMTFPSQGVWYGNGGGSGTAMGSAITNAWGDPDVYFFNPEYRNYTWSDVDPTNPTFYTLEFMLGAPSPDLAANATNCPGGSCTSTKAFLKISQTRGQ